MWPVNAQNAAVINHSKKITRSPYKVSEKHISSLLTTSDSNLLQLHPVKMKHK